VEELKHSTIYSVWGEVRLTTSRLTTNHS